MDVHHSSGGCHAPMAGAMHQVSLTPQKAELHVPTSVSSPDSVSCWEFASDFLIILCLLFEFF